MSNPTSYLKPTRSSSVSRWIAVVLCCFCYAGLAQPLASNTAGFPPKETHDDPYQETANSRALREVLDDLASRYAVEFAYLDQTVEGKFVEIVRLENLSKQAAGQNLETLLENILEPLRLRFKKINNFYTIQPAPENETVIPSLEKKPRLEGRLNPDFIERVSLQLINLQKNTAKVITVSGVVSDENDEPLPGVNVLVKGTANGTITDIQGRYTLNVPDDAEALTFSYVGYMTEEAAINGRTTINVSLRPDVRSLSEVVVIGYGTQRRETVTGSIATVKAEDFNKGVISDPLTLITGKVAGLAVTRPNGADPNARADFSLRGAVSVEGNAQPLIVIDGVPGGDITTVAPQDIESIDVLRDGSAAAIYGSRANAGVILITTKRGAPGEVKVTYSGYTSTEAIARKYNLLSGAQFRQYAAESNIDISARDRGADTDWFNELTRTPFNHGHNLSFSGGTGKTTFNASLNYQNFQGIDLVTNRSFVNARMLLNTKALDDKLDFSLLLTNSHENKTFAKYYGFGQALNMNPTYPVYNEDGTFYETPEFNNQWNPVADTRLARNDQKEKRFLGTARLFYSILPSLRAGVSYSLITTDLLSGNYTQRPLLWMQTSGLNGQASRNQANSTDNIVEATVDYTKSIGQDHNFNVIGGYSYQNQFNEGLGAGNNNFLTDAYSYYNLGAGQALNDLNPGAVRWGAFASSYANEWTLLSYFGRVIYDFRDRYLFNASIRREGASKFGSDHKWGNFWAVSGGWIISREAFMDNVTAIRNLKLRVGYGVTGNQASLQPYQSLAAIGPFPWGVNNGLIGTPDNPRWVPAYGPTMNPNPDLRWETKKELNVGLDFSLFNGDWLNGSIDYYYRKIEDLVGNYYAQVPASIYPLVFANAGELNNKGLELTLNTQFIRSNTINWNATFIGAYNTNRVVSITSDQFQGTAHDVSNIGIGNIQRIAAGQPIGVYYGRRFAGFTDDGKWLFYNRNNEAVTSEQIGDDDYAYLGNSIPKYNLSMTTNFTYRNLDVSVLLRSALGFQAVNANRIFHGNKVYFPNSNIFESAINSPLNDNALFSSYYLERGDYLKVDNVTIGYTIPFARTSFLQNVRISATAMNLFAFTGFSGMDPELGINTFNFPGIEQNSNYYPRTRTFTLGLAAGF